LAALKNYANVHYMQKLNYLQGANPAYIEELYAQYQQNPDSVDSSWRYFFDGLDLGS